MVMSLGYRVCNNPQVFYPGWIRPEHRPVVESQAWAQGELIKKGSVVGINADNLMDLFHSKPYWDFYQFPQVLMPFDKFFVEFKVPGENPFIQWGAFGSVFDRTRLSNDVWHVLGTVPEFKNFHLDKIPLKQVFIDQVLESTRFVMVMDFWSSCGRKPWCGAPFYRSIGEIVLIDKDGKFLDRLPFAAGCGESSSDWGFSQKMMQPNHESKVSEDMEACTSVLGTVFLTASMLHCKNVSVTPLSVEPIIRKHKSPGRNGINITYKTLQVGLSQLPQMRSIEPSRFVGAKSMHICRGHFATYTEDKPLFGKHSGTFWHPQHVRGSRDVGMVVKEYTVLPNQSEQ